VLGPRLTLSDRPVFTPPFVFQGTDGVVATTANGFVPFTADDKVYENPGDKPVMVTITFCNDETDPKDLTVEISDKKVSDSTIPAGKCRTYSLTIPAKKSVCVDTKGRYRIEK
jgi:hypothetical protein